MPSSRSNCKMGLAGSWFELSRDPHQSLFLVADLVLLSYILEYSTNLPAPFSSTCVMVDSLVQCLSLLLPISLPSLEGIAYKLFRNIILCSQRLHHCMHRVLIMTVHVCLL